MIENTLLEQDNRRRRWLRASAGLAAIIAVSAATGWGVASLAAPAAAPDTAKVREALKLRLPKTPIDAITCDGDSASSVQTHLEDHFEGDTPRLSNHIIASVLWDVRGTLGLIRTLAMHADTASNQSDSAGGAK